MTNKENIYSVFDSWLNVSTWHTFHPCDTDRFYYCLSKAMKNKNFDSSDLREYIESKINNEAFSRQIDNYVRMADNIHNYYLYKLNL